MFRTKQFVKAVLALTLVLPLAISVAYAGGDPIAPPQPSSQQPRSSPIPQVSFTDLKGSWHNPGGPSRPGDSYGFTFYGKIAGVALQGATVTVKFGQDRDHLSKSATMSCNSGTNGCKANSSVKSSEANSWGAAFFQIVVVKDNKEYKSGVVTMIRQYFR